MNLSQKTPSNLFFSTSLFHCDVFFFVYQCYNIPVPTFYKTQMSGFCLFGIFRPTLEFFTYLVTSTLPLKGYNFFLPILSTHGH